MTLQVCFSYELQLKLYATVHCQTVKLRNENFQQLNGNKKDSQTSTLHHTH
jgi:hypothetical protein